MTHVLYSAMLFIKCFLLNSMDNFLCIFNEFETNFSRS